MDHTFFPGYRRTLLSPEEILFSIEIPYSKEVRWQEPTVYLLLGFRRETGVCLGKH